MPKPGAQEFVKFAPSLIFVKRAPDHHMPQHQRRAVFAPAHKRGLEAVVLNVDSHREGKHLGGHGVQAERFRAAGKVGFVKFIPGGAPALPQDCIHEGLQRAGVILGRDEFRRQLRPGGVRVQGNQGIEPKARVALHFGAGRAPVALRDHLGLVPLGHFGGAVRAFETGRLGLAFVPDDV